MMEILIQNEKKIYDLRNNFINNVVNNFRKNKGMSSMLGLWS